MNKTVLITGASSGLGLELARLFAKDGYNLVLTARSEDRLNTLKQTLEKTEKVKVWVFPADLAKINSADEIFNFTIENGINIDVLVNNAGFGSFGPFSESDISKQADMVSVNVTSLMKLCRLFVEPMIERKDGKILNMASIAAFQAGPLMSVYYATKAFVLSFSEALSEELKGTGVSVTAVCPGPTKTEFEGSADLGASGLFKNLKVATASDVSKYGYRKLMKRKVIAVHGFMNRITVCLSKLMPRSLVRKVVYMIQK